MEIKIAVAFAAVVAGFVGAVAYVPLALVPSTRHAERIQHRYAEAVRGISELRACGREMRSAALTAYQARGDPTVDRAAQEAAVAHGRERCRAMVSRLTTERMSDAALSAWQHFTTIDMPAHEAAVDAVLAASYAPVGRVSLVRQLFETVAQGDETLASMVDVHAAEARSEAEQIHAALRRLSTSYIVLAAVAAVGAIVLLLECLGLLRQYARSAHERLAELEVFPAQVAHDLRGPLQTIQLTVQMIEKKTENVAVKRLASSATVSVQRLVAMIRDLLQFARSGAEISEHATTNVASVVSQTCEELLPRAERAQVKVTTRSDPCVQARVAPVALKTIVANLLENALKYRHPGHQNVVDVSATCSGDHVRLVVKDRGTGIPREILPHVFEPFVRGSRRADSYGLGLATVKRLVDAHGGTIAVESEEGCGTTFVIQLPAARVPTMSGPGSGMSSA